MKGDCTPKGFEHVGKTDLCGKANRGNEEQGKPEAEEGREDEAVEAPIATLLGASTRASARADAPTGKKGGGSVGSWKLN